MDVQSILTNITSHIVDAGLKLMAALLLWLVGRWLIRAAIRIMSNGMRRQAVDATIILYAQNIVSVLCNIALVIAILGFFGVETTSFAAFIAGASVAIGAAWAGLLSNFAAGAFLVILRPFKTGDFISAGGVTGTVDSIGMFVTGINTPDNVRTYVGNAKIFSDNIQNYHTNATRRVELTAPLAHTQDVPAVVAQLKARIARIPNVATDPAVDITILSVSAAGLVLAVRPHTHNDHYWQVYFDTNAAIKEVVNSGGFPPAGVKIEIPVSM